MMRFAVTWALVGLFLCSSAQVVLAQKTSQAKPDKRFKMWDKNEDGKLQRSELPEAIRKHFDKVDRNKDGVISQKEHTDFINRLRRYYQSRPKVWQRYKNIEQQVDLPYAATENPCQRLDLLLPKKRATDKPLPVVVFIHGGGWQGGNKTGGRGNVSPLVESGHYAGVSVGYRLSGEAIWPAQIHDCKAAIRWIKGNAKKYNLDPEKIGVWGSSAGGHLVAMLGVSGDVKELEGALGKHTDQDSRVACVVDWFGPTNMMNISRSARHANPNSPVAKLLGGPVSEKKEAARSASPVTHISAGDSPTLIVHGDKDPVVPISQSTEFEAALRKAGIPVILVTVEGAGHGQFRNREVQHRVKTFFERHLQGKNVEVHGGTIKPE